MNTQTIRTLPAIPIYKTNASQKAAKGSGTCPVCWSVFKTHSSDGTLHRHGPRRSPCPGSDQQPITVQPTLTGAGTSRSDKLQITQTNITNTLESELSHPVLLGPLIKHIPRANRMQCADLLSVILRSISSNPTDLNSWRNLLTFGPVILSKPTRGGKRRNVSTIIATRNREWISSEIRVVELDETVTATTSKSQ